MSHVETALLRDGAVLQLTFDGGKGNILTGALMAELEAALAASEQHRAVKLVLLRGAGKHFSFGASVEEHRAAQAPQMLRGFHALLRRVIHFPAPTLALVDGQCLGGAFELALACDFVFASPTAKLGCPEIKLGVFAPALAALGPLRLRPPFTTRLMLTGETLDAPSALDAGAVTRLCEGDLTEAALAWFDEHLAPLSAHSLRVSASVARETSGLYAAEGTTLAAAIQRYERELLPSHDGNEGIEAFLERRAPRWEHR